MSRGVVVVQFAARLGRLDAEANSRPARAKPAGDIAVVKPWLGAQQVDHIKMQIFHLFALRGARSSLAKPLVSCHSGDLVMEAVGSLGRPATASAATFHETGGDSIDATCKHCSGKHSQQSNTRASQSVAAGDSGW